MLRRHRITTLWNWSKSLPAPTALLLAYVCFAGAAEILPPGHRPLPPGVHALVGGKVFVKPGEVISNGVVVVRDGLIERVGGSAEVALPADARVWDAKGCVIYAGFIDPYLALTTTNPPVTTSRVEPIQESAGELTAAGGIRFFGVPGEERDPGNPGPGSELAGITPERRAASGYAPDLKTLAGLRELGFAAACVVPDRGIVRGTSAFVLLADANPNDAILRADVFQHVGFDAEGAREGAFPRSLMGVIAAVRQIFFDAQHAALDRADYARNPVRKRPPFNPALEALVPAVEHKMRVVFEPGSALMTDRAARVARELGLDLALVSCGQEWRRPDLARETGAAFIVPVNFPALPKLPDGDDWEQITLDQLRAWDWAPENPAVLHQAGREIALTTYALADRKHFRANLRLALLRGLPEDIALAALTTVPAKLCGVDTQLGTVTPGKLANLTVVAGESYFHADAKVREVWIEGRVHRIVGESADAAPSSKTNSASATAKKAETEKLQRERVARSPREGRGPLAEPRSVLVQNATIWTCGPQGILTNASLLISSGTIQQVGQFKVELSADTLVVDAAGRHVTPGLIDCHSHTAILGGVNEGSIPSSAMCRIEDVVNSETPNFHQQLAGGLTVANLLHGSANPIGGQNCVIKLREGASPEELRFAVAPAGIKFALGENVKQANWGDKNVTRFPQTRMGVRTFFANRFTAARDYLRAAEEFRVRATGVPPRRDLELEALAEVLQGKRLIHCHSYRQDEILAFLRTCEEFGVRVATLHHVLEGYKVADEIARHGAGGSCFSDWWAYKFEVYDAIPYAGSLMRERGVVVSFNSDSSELARRMYLEAAKAVKYGGTGEAEALQFVTLNPAKQLGIEARAGSLEPGKDGDFALWTHAPLDSRTVCLQTWIEGKKFFDRTNEVARAESLRLERTALVEKAKKTQKGGGEPDAGEPARQQFFRSAWEQAHRLMKCGDCAEVRP